MARRRAFLEKERPFYLISLEKLKIIHFIYYRNYYEIEQFIYQKIRAKIQYFVLKLFYLSLEINLI